MSADMISEEDFTNVWGAGAQDSGELYTHEQIKDCDLHRVWTVVEGGDEDDNWYALAGFHVVNAMGYVLSIRTWETGLEQAMWCEA